LLGPGGDVQYGDVGEPAVEQGVDQDRRTARLTSSDHSYQPVRVMERRSSGEPGRVHLVREKLHLASAAAVSWRCSAIRASRSVSEAERDRAWQRILAAARRYHAEVSAASWRDLAKDGEDRTR
jgi:hypothetical protein